MGADVDELSHCRRASPTFLTLAADLDDLKAEDIRISPHPFPAHRSAPRAHHQINHFPAQKTASQKNHHPTTKTSSCFLSSLPPDKTQSTTSHAPGSYQPAAIPSLDPYENLYAKKVSESLPPREPPAPPPPGPDATRDAEENLVYKSMMEISPEAARTVGVTQANVSQGSNSNQNKNAPGQVEEQVGIMNGDFSILPAAGEVNPFPYWKCEGPVNAIQVPHSADTVRVRIPVGSQITQTIDAPPLWARRAALLGGRFSVKVVANLGAMVDVQITNSSGEAIEVFYDPETMYYERADSRMGSRPASPDGGRITPGNPYKYDESNEPLAGPTSPTGRSRSAGVMVAQVEFIWPFVHLDGAVFPSPQPVKITISPKDECEVQVRKVALELQGTVFHVNSQALCYASEHFKSLHSQWKNCRSLNNSVNVDMHPDCVAKQINPAFVDISRGLFDPRGEGATGGLSVDDNANTLCIDTNYGVLPEGHEITSEPLSFSKEGVEIALHMIYSPNDDDILQPHITPADVFLEAYHLLLKLQVRNLHIMERLRERIRQQPSVDLLLLARQYGYVSAEVAAADSSKQEWTSPEYDLAGAVLEAFSRFCVNDVMKIPHYRELSQKDQLQVAKTRMLNLETHFNDKFNMHDKIFRLRK